VPDNIFLIGPMGAGKSSIGKRLAKRLNREFIDSDHLLEEKTGVTITTIFELEGEIGFRDRESKVLAELSQRTGIVIATGGGAILREENRQLMNDNGIVIYLSAKVETQLKRTLHDKNRPLLENNDRHAKLIQLAEHRNPLYTAMADISIETDTQSIGASIKQIIELLPS
jgi:shikimate kinase